MIRQPNFQTPLILNRGHPDPSWNPGACFCSLLYFSPLHLALKKTKKNLCTYPALRTLAEKGQSIKANLKPRLTRVFKVSKTKTKNSHTQEKTQPGWWTFIFILSHRWLLPSKAQLTSTAFRTAQLQERGGFPATDKPRGCGAGCTLPPASFQRDPRHKARDRPDAGWDRDRQLRSPSAPNAPCSRPQLFQCAIPSAPAGIFSRWDKKVSSLERERCIGGCQPPAAILPGCISQLIQALDQSLFQQRSRHSRGPGVPLHPASSQQRGETIACVAAPSLPTGVSEFCRVSPFASRGEGSIR